MNLLNIFQLKRINCFPDILSLPKAHCYWIRNKKNNQTMIIDNNKYNIGVTTLPEKHQVERLKSKLN